MGCNLRTPDLNKCDTTQVNEAPWGRYKNVIQNCNNLYNLYKDSLIVWVTFIVLTIYSIRFQKICLGWQESKNYFLFHCTQCSQLHQNAWYFQYNLWMFALRTRLTRTSACETLCKTKPAGAVCAFSPLNLKRFKKLCTSYKKQIMNVFLFEFQPFLHPFGYILKNS